jgi:arylsulfatase B
VRINCRLACFSLLFSLGCRAHATGGNVLVIVADDMGIDKFAAYDVHPEPAPTPVLDELASQGVLFRNAYSYPTCSPSRACALTGRYGRRNGAGQIISGGRYEVPLGEVFLPELLNLIGYSTAAFGKWHMSARDSSRRHEHPNLQGFDHFSGSMQNMMGNQNAYAAWTKVVDGKVVDDEYGVYATTDTTNDAIDFVTSTEEPWFVWLAYNAPHAEYHVPPAHLHTDDTLTEDSPIPDMVDAMIESMDTEIGRLLAEIDLEETTVFFFADNGTARDAVRLPEYSPRAKGTMYEGGVRVPMFVAGRAVSEPGESDALIHILDTFATVLDIAGLDLEDVMDANAIDSVSLMPYFAEPAAPFSHRQTVYTEAFKSNGGPPYREDARMIRDHRWKLIEEDGKDDEFYDLLGLGEEVDLRQREMTDEQLSAYEALKSAMRDTLSELKFDY